VALELAMNAIDNKILLNQLQWRYATKQFDAKRKISPQDWATLEAALVLSPSSCGLQPWKFIVVTDPGTRQKLVPVSHEQSKVAEASHLVVFAVKTEFGEKEVDAHVARVAEVRGVSIESLAPMRGMMLGVVRGMDETKRRDWESRQLYLALGTLLTTAALMGIDAAPMEGIVPAEYDALLGLAARKLTTVVACALGYRASTDAYAGLPKVRFRKEDVILHV
jgi:nitroreductase